MAEMKKCPNCGEPVESTASWCASCGQIFSMGNDERPSTPELVDDSAATLANEAPSRTSEPALDASGARVPTSGFKLCPSCAEEVRVEARKCRHCGESFLAGPQEAANGIETPKVLGLAGSAILVVGVFLPILSLPVVGSINYIADGRGDGVLILVLAMLGVLFSVLELYGWLVVPGLGTLATVAFTIDQFQQVMVSARAELTRDLADNPFRGFADAAFASVGLEWGFAVLILGAAVLLAAAVIAARK